MRCFALLPDSCRAMARAWTVKAFGLGMLATVCCSCTSLRPMTAVDPFANQSQTEAATTAPSADKTQSVQLATHEEPAPPPPPPPAPPPPGLVQLDARQSRPVIQLTDGGAVDPATTWNASETRVPLPQCPPNAFGPYGLSGPVGMTLADVTSPELYPDEYLFDGGDRDMPVHYGRHVRYGLETEDTVIEYTDPRGREYVQPSNRVAIYAPRFSAVRTVSEPIERSTVAELASVDNTTREIGVESLLAPTHRVQRTQADGMRMRSRASGLEGEIAQGGVTQSNAAVENSRLTNLYQSFNFLRMGQHRQTDEAQLASAIQAAVKWSQTGFPVIAAQSQSAHEELVEAGAAEFVLVEEPPKKPGRLQIVKLADKATALPGEIVSFVIRYDNLGDLPVDHVRIVDNLTPRLEYVENSARCDRAGQLIIEDNDEGSVILTWQFAEPLPGKTGGTVAFQARVR